MIHYGDITKIKGSEIPIVDIVTGGSPCQDLSVAGKRAGLDGERSGLFMEQIRIIKEMREVDIQNGRTDEFIRPRYMVWENVTGAFSSNNGEDFRIVLEETAKVKDKNAVIPGLKGGQKWTPSGVILGNGWSIAWRVHDAQFWGVPQRRKRIALVADFGGSTAPEILFERKGLSGNTPQSECEGQEVTGAVGEGADSAGCYTLKIRGGREVDSQGKKAGKGPLVQTELSGTIGVSQDQTLIAKQKDQICYGISSYDSNSIKSSNPNSGIYEADTSRTLDNNGGNPSCNQGGICVLEGNGSRPSRRGDGFAESEISYTLNSTEKHAVCTYQQTTGPLCASGYEKQGTQEATNDMYVVEQKGTFWDGSQTASTLTANNANGAQRMPDKENFNAVITCTTEMTPKIDENGVAFSLRNRDHKDPPCVVIENHPADSRVKVSEEGIFQTLSSRMGTGGGNVPMVMEGQKTKVSAYTKSGFTSNQLASDDMFVANQFIVRRLTPLECERLQGYPDGWTDIGDWVDSKGKTHKGESDSPRYKALGNSIALPFWEYLAEKMCAQYDRPTTMASLFDGIGGFPLVFSRHGCTPVWASEIEEFPIAVTKLRFPEKGANE